MKILIHTTDIYTLIALPVAVHEYMVQNAPYHNSVTGCCLNYRELPLKDG